MARKAGRFWFSVPSPYVTHEPTLGRTIRGSPQFISISAGSWLGRLVTIERITAMSSMHDPTCENRSLTSIPLCPYLRKPNGDGSAAPVLLSVRRLEAGKLRPAYRARSGLGSKVSTWDGPPFMNRWITCLALAGRGGVRGARGLLPVAASAGVAAL